MIYEIKTTHDDVIKTLADTGIIEIINTKNPIEPKETNSTPQPTPRMATLPNHADIPVIMTIEDLFKHLPKWKVDNTVTDPSAKSTGKSSYFV